MKKTKAELEKENAELLKEIEFLINQRIEANSNLFEARKELDDARKAMDLLCDEITALRDDIDKLHYIREMAYDDEPPMHSIVMDVDGFAWQRFAHPRDGWYLASMASDDTAGEGMGWTEVNLRYGPITILNRIIKGEQ